MADKNTSTKISSRTNSKNHSGSILKKSIIKKGKPVIAYDARKRYFDGEKYRDITKRCYSMEEAESVLKDLAKKYPNKPLKHGHTSKQHSNHKSLTYSSYEKAKERCNNPKANKYEYYGGRGIEFRFNSFTEFLEEVGERPNKTMTIDRINSDGHYEKGNVRWANRIVQSQNRRNAKANKNP